MGNLILPTITPEAMMGETATTVTKKVTTGFDAKNYLDVRLDEAAGEKSKVKTIRLLPMNLQTGNPFVRVHIHNVKVPTDVSKSGYKSYLCLAKNQDIDHDKFGHKCPFCELNSSAYKDSMNETDPVKKKALQDISIANHSKEAVIVRCIERGKEDEGVKFWKFNIRNDKTDPYNQILNLYNQRKEEGERAGVPTNILDIINGVDLTVTITEGNAAPTIMDARFSTPLSTDEEQMRAWIYDEKKWQEVFTPKSYEYLSLISAKKVPWFDRESETWVDKEEYEARQNQKKAMAENDVRTAESILTGVTNTTRVAQVNTEVSNQAPSLPSNMIVREETDLPW